MRRLIPQRLRVWWRKRRRRWAAKKEQGAPLREFVYLDEVSVYSLIASRIGAIAAEFTDTESSSLRSEFGGSVGGSAGVAKASAESRASATYTVGSQVVRKSIIQTQFKELTELEGKNLALRDRDIDGKLPRISSRAELESLTKEAATGSWVVAPENLHRGALVDVEVELEAEPIFRVSTIMSTMLDIINENPALFGTTDPRALRQAIAANRMLSRLLAGLVPVRGRVLDYKAVDLDDGPVLVHEAVLSQLTEDDPPPAREIFVVGVAETELFWKDIRRVLFSGSRYSVMGRLARPGLNESWTPVKLADVLAEVVPQIGDALSDDAGGGLLAIMRRGARDAQTESATQTQTMRNALRAYADALATRHGKSFDVTELDGTELLEVEVSSNVGVEDQRAAFAPLTEYLHERLHLAADPQLEAELRSEALEQAEVRSATGPDPDMSDLEPSAATAPPLYLDAEIVAMYW